MLTGIAGRRQRATETAETVETVETDRAVEMRAGTTQAALVWVFGGRARETTDSAATRATVDQFGAAAPAIERDCLLPEQASKKRVIKASCLETFECLPAVQLHSALRFLHGAPALAARAH